MPLNLNDPVAVAARAAADQFHTLLSMWLGGIIYGLYLILFVLSVRITMRTKRSQWTFSAKVFFVATFVMLLLTTTWMGINAHRFLYAFSPKWTAASGGRLPIDYLRILDSTWDNYTNVVIMNVLTWLADALIIYRCFIIWNRNFWIIIPSCLVLLLSLVSCGMTITWFRHPTIFTYAQVMPLLNMTYPINIVQSCLTTGLITIRIWRSYARSRSAGLYAGTSGGGLLTVMRIIVESAMIFTVQQIVLCILYYLDSPAQYVFHGTMVPSIGVVFVLLAIRAYGVTHPDTSPSLPWPDINSATGLRTATVSASRSPYSPNTHIDHRSARARHHRRTASDGLIFTRSGFRDETPVTLTIPDTNIYTSSGTNSAVDGDIEKGDMPSENEAGTGGGGKQHPKHG